MWIETTSAEASIPARSSARVADPNCSSARYGSKAVTSIPSALATFATRRGIRPNPTSASSFPLSSSAVWDLMLASSPCRRSRWRLGRRLATASIRAMVCSAVGIVGPSGKLQTQIPRSVASAILTASYSIPVRVMIARFGARSITSPSYGRCDATIAIELSMSRKRSSGSPGPNTVIPAWRTSSIPGQWVRSNQTG